MARTKLTPRRRGHRLTPWMLRQNRIRQRTKRTYPYKIKLTLPEQKQVDITKNGDVSKTININVNRNISSSTVQEYFNSLIIKYCKISINEINFLC